RQRDQVYRELIEALAEHGVADIPYKELKNGEREYVRAWYREAMRPLLMPQIIDPSHPFPHLKNKTLYAAALLREGDKRRLGIVGV
ncbi:Copper chaperone, partial [Dysosmobacter welbionis]